ncbi:uncharacterized protein BT62DRAFT_583745 [Guyanagaster necrorhizus]|uniref:Mediator of RNA polymerase II transcription subunit 8 n=1 Tax=Guyanagaster necrorhizus TaxID=856835 RepID=A0A9P7VH24_9AGAR|nr:uncharacterized protein BT62DRAFT_583745 [Guyanagaster necrorhizus MCA 3950]KAG7440447.1 hypothetical protein BT62DRAFT_583745 [Guyanagaster necrorhizus MCA 3950]
MANLQMNLDSSSLPTAHLESLKFKASQIVESIQALQRTIESGYQNTMPPWPDILSKYNILLSQTHSLSSSLVSPIYGSVKFNGSAPTDSSNPYEKIALHPRAGMPDTQLDNDVIPLLRNQQTLDVLKMETDTVRRLSEHMKSRGSLGVLGGLTVPSTQQSRFGAIPKKPEYEDVLEECNEIRAAHDARVDRAVRAVTMLRDKFDWKQRVEVEVEEPEELDWDPRFQSGPGGDGMGPMDVDMDAESSDEDEVESHLNGGEGDEETEIPIQTSA